MPYVQQSKHDSSRRPLFLKLLQFTVMAQSAHVGLADSSIIGACVPYSVDHLRQPDVVGLEFVEAPHHQQCRHVEGPVEEFAESGMLLGREVVGNTGPVVMLDAHVLFCGDMHTGSPYASG